MRGEMGMALIIIITYYEPICYTISKTIRYNQGNALYGALLYSKTETRHLIG